MVKKWKGIKMKIIIGLGNFGKEYEKSCHNAGFMVIDKVLEQLKLIKNKQMCDGQVWETNIGGEKIYFVKPTTYMNLSGRCVKSLMEKFKCDIQDLLVVVDDIDIPAGSVRIRKKGSAGTHNGLRSIVEYCSTEFARIRVGCDKPNPHQSLADFVLSSVPASSNFYKGIEKASLAVIDYINGRTLDSVMQKYNG